MKTGLYSISIWVLRHRTLYGFVVSFHTIPHILILNRERKLGTDLAINGGEPTLDSSVFQWPIATDEIRSSVLLALEDGSWGQYESRWTELVIEKLESFHSSELEIAPSALLCSSGTIAVELALRGTDVKPEDEVILAGYDFPGNFRAIEAIGARPVLADVVPNGWVLDPAQVEQAISEQTSAIIVSHLHGQTADIKSIREIADAANTEKKIRIVEDVCQVPGGKLNGRPLGTFGDVAAFSFGGSKLLSAGRGGAIMSADAGILQRAKIFSQRGNEAFPLSQLQAAALGPQFDTLLAMTDIRNDNANWLIENTKHFDVLVGLGQVVADTLPAFYKLPWLLRDRPAGWTRAEFVRALIAEGVPIGEGFRGFLRRSPRRCRKIGTLVNCQIAAQQTVVLHHPILLQPQATIVKVAAAFEKIVTSSPL
ncbi:MAG: DegT/DnrJ/EryC1/StrS family aminotransferase [Mariniblastus sp.]